MEEDEDKDENLSIQIALRCFKSDYEANIEEDEDENLSIQIDEYSHINEN